MSLRVRTTCFRVFWGLRRREPTAKKAAAAAAAEVVLVVVRAATPKTWPRSTPKTTDTGDTSRGRLSSDDQNRSLFISLADGCSAGRLLLFVSVFPSRRRYFVYICIANHSAVSKPHPTEGAEIYCIQAAGIIAATKCAVRCASSHSVVDTFARHAALRGLPLRSVFSDHNLNINTHNNVPLAFFLLPSQQSIGISPEDPTTLKKVDKAPVGPTSFFTEITDGFHSNYRRIFTISMWFCALYYY